MAQAAGLTIGLVLLSRVTGVMRDIALAHEFGQRGDVSVFRAAFGVPDLIALVIAGGAVSTVFIPIFSQYWNDKREDEAWKVFGSVLTLVGVIVAALVACMEIGVVPLTQFLNLKFGPEDVAKAAALTQILLPVQWCLMIGGLLMGTLYARKRFLVPGVGPILYNVGQIVGCVVFGAKFGIASVAWGALIGAFAGSVLLPLFEMRRVGVQWRLGFDVKHPGVVKMGKLMVPILLGQSLSQLNMWLTTRFLPADSRIAALTNAYNLTQAPIGIFAQAFAIVLLPTIALYAAQKDWRSYRETVSDGLRRVFFLTIPASAIMAALAAPLIRLIYVHGKFTEADVPMAATALFCYSIATFAWSGTSILARGFHAMQETRTPIYVTTPMVAIFVISAYVYTHLSPNGFVGLALSTSFCGVVSMLLLLFLLQKRIGGLNLRGIALSTAKITASSLAAAGVAHVLDRALEPHLRHGTIGATVIVLGVGGIACAVYAGLCFVLRVPELWTIREMFRKTKTDATADLAVVSAQETAAIESESGMRDDEPYIVGNSTTFEKPTPDPDGGSAEALAEFGRRYVQYVRDRSIRRLDRQIFTDPESFAVRPEISARIDPEILKDLIPHIVDMTLVQSLAFFEANPDVRMTASSGDTEIDIAEEGGGHTENHYAEWVREFSLQRVPGSEG